MIIFECFKIGQKKDLCTLNSIVKDFEIDPYVGLEQEHTSLFWYCL
jgi:hypothetical protein